MEAAPSTGRAAARSSAGEQQLHGKEYRNEGRPMQIEEQMDTQELRKWPLYRDAIVELVATLLIMYVIMSTAKAFGKGNGAAAELAKALAWGGAVFVMIYCTTAVSGGHLNPAVTVAMLLLRRMPLLRAALYVVAQCIGAALGAWLAGPGAAAAGANALGAGHGLGRAFVVEALGSFIVIYAVMSAADSYREARDSRLPVLSPLPIGFAVMMAYLATSSITGAGINPAKSFASALIGNQSHPWRHHWVFWIGPLVGSVLAMIYHEFVVRGCFYRTSSAALPDIGADV